MVHVPSIFGVAFFFFPFSLIVSFPWAVTGRDCRCELVHLGLVLGKGATVSVELENSSPELPAELGNDEIPCLQGSLSDSLN